MERENLEEAQEGEVRAGWNREGKVAEREAPFSAYAALS
jgi:hypothetical protein